jgi:hypothetical protein
MMRSSVFDTPMVLFNIWSITMCSLPQIKMYTRI